MTQSALVIVRAWQEKSSVVANQSNDGLVTAVSKGFDAMAAVLSKDSNPVHVDRALTYLNVERSISLKFDTCKDDPLRDLVYGLLESLHGSLNEWNEERNQKKETGEISTHTDEESTVCLLGPLIRPCESSISIDNNPPNDLSINSSPVFPIEPKEEPIDDSQALPHEYQISASELMRDEKMFKEEEMDNENNDGIIASSHPIPPHSLDLLDQGLNITRSAPLNPVVDPMDMSQILPRDNQMPPFNELRHKMDFKEEEMLNDDVNSGMGEAVDSSLNEQIEDDHRTIRPSEFLEYQINIDDEMFSDSVKNGRSMQVSRSESSKNKRKSYKGEEESEDVVKKRRVSKRNETELDCPACEFRTLSAHSWVAHLRLKHSTNPALAGLALLCGCGKENLSDEHSRTCAHGNSTVITKRDGPIRRLEDGKTTPQCVLCEAYPKTASGYVYHLYLHHKSTLAHNGVYLVCSCGLEVRNRYNREHVDECNPRQFTLHKLDDE